MKTKSLFGLANREVSRLGLGCMGMSGVYGAASDEDSKRTILRALDLGCDFLDTADVYGAGHNEQLVGAAIRGRRDSVFLASKFGLSGLSNNPAGTTVNGSPEYALAACDKSLARLGVDCIDLYYLHRLDANTPIEDTVGAMAQLVKAGKVKYLGLSEVSPTTLRQAAKVHPITAVQSEYSLWTLDPEHGILAACRELGVMFVPYSPLGRGMLTGALGAVGDLPEKDWRRSAPRFQDGAFAKNLALVHSVGEVAKKKGCTTGQIALAWLLAQGDDIFPIPGTKRIPYLEENWGALGVTLTAEETASLRKIAETTEIVGHRYPPGAVKHLDK